ncbi:hypothetical protein COV24_00785 [candidate division WWE3 bacterium CG10_big_fil_rev_8_21_14_0_10_32_10]|uniref:Uncharacterized protein n=1 Tax=candidate division WWE3 bacterium CG10_big_fil_rev_8_21_14_0_10_32_10 TaxID=1975090 RepID=A0A2H0RBB9_UNCKA|nr:MAG: hypothetical protein COV24_00785 [candidate division WWE3 bacterium CG10_big_fil_rev_8_21_14_0_10_32_10]
MSKKQFLIGFGTTFTIFALFVFFFLEPKFGPQLTNVNQDPDTNTETSLTPTPLENDAMNPDYGNLSEDQQKIADKAIGNLLNSISGLNPSMIKVLNIEEKEFNDSSLECPKEGENYAKVVTPGYKITLQADNIIYDYRVASEGDNIILCEE